MRIDGTLSLGLRPTASWLRFAASRDLRRPAKYPERKARGRAGPSGMGDAEAVLKEAADAQFEPIPALLPKLAWLRDEMGPHRRMIGVANDRPMQRCIEPRDQAAPHPSVADDLRVGLVLGKARPGAVKGAGTAVSGKGRL